MGRVTEVSESWVAIQTDTEGEKRLRLADETVITLDGRDVSASELEEGQEIRASYNTDEQGRPTAVMIVDAP